MRLRSVDKIYMQAKPDCGTLPWLAAALTILGAAGRIFLPAVPLWPHYLFFTIVAALALTIAYLGWRCHVERQLPAPHIRKLLTHLSEKKGFSGTAVEFNRDAQRVLYGQEFSEYIREPTDYFSLLIANDFVKIVGASDIGTSESGLYIALTDKAEKAINNFPRGDAA